MESEKSESKKDNEVKKTKFKEYAEILGNLVSTITFSSIIYGAILLLSFSASHNIDFIDLMSTKLLISVGSISSIIIMLIIGIILFILYINFGISDDFRKYYTRPQSQGYASKAAIITLNSLICLWPVVLIKSGSFAYAIIYPAAISLLWLKAYDAITKKHNTIELKEQNKKFKYKANKYSICIIPSLEVLIILLAATLFFRVFNNELKGSSDYVFFAIAFVINFIGKIPLIPTNGKTRKSISQTIALIITAELFLMLSSPFSDSIVKTTADMIGITAKNKCFLKKDINRLGIPSIYIDKNRSNVDYIKLNIITKTDDVIYLSTIPEGQTKEPRKSSARIKGIIPIEVECPNIK